MNTLRKMKNTPYIQIIAVLSILMALGGMRFVGGFGTNSVTIYFLSAISTGILGGLYATILIAILHTLDGSSRDLAFVIGGMVGAISGAIFFALMTIPIMFWLDTFLSRELLNQHAYEIAHLPFLGIFFGWAPGGILGAILSLFIHAHNKNNNSSDME